MEQTQIAPNVVQGCRVGPRAMVVLMFQARFAPKVESGEKRRTIRPDRKRPVKVGDPVSLRQWTGRPYASKQRVLRTGTITRVEPVRLSYAGVLLESGMLLGFQEREFAQADGFESAAEMLSWFVDNHGIPFRGTLIEWANNQL